MQLEIGGGNVTCVQQQMVFGFEQLLLTDLCVINYYIFVNSKFLKQSHYVIQTKKELKQFLLHISA